jgi:hypothetical protein
VRTDEHINPTLDVDTDIEAAIHEASDGAADRLRAMYRAARDRAAQLRVLFGIARRWRDLIARDASLETYGAMIADQIMEKRARLATEIGELEDSLGSLALALRQETGELEIDLPGVARIVTRLVPARSRFTDDAAFVACLSGDERERYLTPQPDRIDKRAVHADLNALRERRGGALPEGMEFGEARVTATVHGADESAA